MEYGIILQDLEERIGRLEWNRKMFVLAVLARALSPLVDQVARFAGDAGGDVVREAVAVASQVSAGTWVNAGHALVESLGRVIPHSEDITEMEEYYALDTFIMIDAALRAAVREGAIDGMVAEYALLPLHEYLCDREYGYLDIGSSPEEEAWEAGLSEDPVMAEGIRFVDSVVTRAESGEPVTVDEIIAISVRGRVLLPPTG